VTNCIDQLHKSGGDVRRLKVVRIIARLNGGGPARQACHLHSALRRYYDTVLVYGALNPGEEDMSYLLSDDTGVHRLSTMTRSLSVWGDLLTLVQVFLLLLRERPDIVHTHTAKAGTIGRIAAFFARVPIRIHTYHGNVFDGYFRPAVTKLVIATERAMSLITTSVIAISPSQAEELTQRFRVVPSRKLSVIQTGFDLTPYLRSSRDEMLRARFGCRSGQIMVVWAGRLVAIKNVELLIRIVSLARGDSSIRFVVVGEGEMRPMLEEAAKTLPSLILAGWQRDMAAVWAASDAALLTSHNEGTPASLIEAMASGRPFVATRVGGVVDLLAPAISKSSDKCWQAANGFATLPEPEEMLKSLRRLQSNPQLRDEMGRTGRHFAAMNHNDTRLLNQIDDLYRTLAKQILKETL